MKKNSMIEKMLKDGSGLIRIMISDTICKDCKHKIPWPDSACKKYELKPAAVFKGKCSEYEKEEG